MAIALLTTAVLRTYRAFPTSEDTLVGMCLDAAYDKIALYCDKKPDSAEDAWPEGLRWEVIKAAFMAYEQAKKDLLGKDSISIDADRLQGLSLEFPGKQRASLDLYRTKKL